MLSFVCMVLEKGKRTIPLFLFLRGSEVGRRHLRRPGKGVRDAELAGIPGTLYLAFVRFYDDMLKI